MQTKKPFDKLAVTPSQNAPFKDCVCNQSSMKPFELM